VRELSIKAIVIGAVVDTLGSFLLGAIAIMFLLGRSSAHGKDALEDVEASLAYQLVALIGGLVLLTVGGAIAAKLAPHAPVKNAVAVGVCCVVFSILTSGIWLGREPTWWVLLSLVLTIPAAALGGVVVRRRSTIS
jgi:hypothetical protein